MKWEHLGDGIYVAFDGYQILIRANSHLYDPTFALEPVVFRNLVEYANEIWKKPHANP